jgi:hypothetical protein
MTIVLAGPVSAFFEAGRTQDLEALARCFSEWATVRDEGRTVEGPDAIKRSSFRLETPSSCRCRAG